MQTILICQGNTAAMDGLFSTYYVHNKIIFEYFKAYHWITPEPEMEQVLMLLIQTAHHMIYHE